MENNKENYLKAVADIKKYIYNSDGTMKTGAISSVVGALLGHIFLLKERISALEDRNRHDPKRRIK